MPLDAKQFSLLKSDVINLHARERLLLDLYADEQNIELLNKAAPRTFYAIQSELLEMLIIDICRLAADEKNSLTLASLVADATTDELGKLMTQLKTAVEPLRRRRNKSIAHRDTDHAMDAELLPKVTKDTFDNALELIRRIMNAASKSRGELPVDYAGIIKTDTRDLVDVIKDGMNHRQLPKSGGSKE